MTTFIAASTTSRSLLALLGGAALTLPACTMSETGDDGRASFSVSDSSTCAFGCEPATNPLAVGATATMNISSLPSAGGLSITSDAPSVLQVGAGDFASSCAAGDAGCKSGGQTSVSLAGLSAGTANVVVKRGDGTVYDQVAVFVEKPVKGALQVGGKTVTSLALSIGKSQSVSAALLDGSGRTLLSDGVIAVWSPASQTVAVSQQLLGSYSVEGAGAGQTTIDVGMPGSPLTQIPVTVK